MKITIHMLASDDNNGTHAAAFGSEREAEDEMLAACGGHYESYTRADYEAWLAKAPDDPDRDIYEFARQHAGDLDTYSLEEETVDVRLIDQPLPPTGREQVAQALECLRRARQLIRAADNRQTLRRVEAAISSAKGAGRIQIGREVRAEHERQFYRDAGALAQRQGLARETNPLSEKPEFAAKRTLWFEGYDAEAASPNPYRRSNLFVSGIRGLGHGADFEKVPDEFADSFAVLRRDQCPDGFDLLSVSVDFFDERDEAESYLDSIAVEG